MKKNWYFALCAVLVLALVAILPFVFDNTFLNEGGKLAVYLVAKILFALVFIGLVVYVFIGKGENGAMLPLLSAGVIAQLFPLGIRFLLQIPNETAITWAVIVMIFVLALLVAFLGAMLTMNKKMKVSTEKQEGKTIAVKDESSLYDENNNFKGRE